MTKKYTDKQLSIILWAHSNGLLKKYGQTWNDGDFQQAQYIYNGCISTTAILLRSTSGSLNADALISLPITSQIAALRRSIMTIIM